MRNETRLRALIAISSALAASFVACTSALPEPTMTEQRVEALAVVPFPPPPARTEMVPPRPVSGAVWVDGEWVWRGRRWAWKRGRWVAPPAGATYSPWTMTRDAEGAVLFAPGVWRDARGQAIDDPPALALGEASSGPVVDPEGEMEMTGANVAADRPARKDGGP